jgi:ATP-dependent RNA helicase RhlE
VYFVDQHAKPELLVQYLREQAAKRALVFTRTKHGADRVTRDLERDGFDAAVIHGNKSQNARQKALNGFRDGSVRILVATDIAARGIDVPGISHVVNYELPDEAESYVHRIGRTGRNGADGIAITLCDPGENAKLRQVERIIRMKLNVTADHLGQPDPKAEPRNNDRGPMEAANDRNGHRNGNNRPRGEQKPRNGFGKKPFQGKPGDERKPFRGKRRSFGSGKPASRAA